MFDDKYDHRISYLSYGRTLSVDIWIFLMMFVGGGLIGRFLFLGYRFRFRISLGRLLVG